MTAPEILLDHCDVGTCSAVAGVEVLISADGGRSVWCTEHIGDDWLPVLVSGICGGCAVCGHACIWWAPNGGPCLHERCRRAWAAGRPPAPTASGVKHGAYGRRAG